MCLCSRHICRRASAEFSMLPVLVSLCRGRLRRFFFFIIGSTFLIFTTYQYKSIIYYISIFVNISCINTFFSLFTNLKTDFLILTYILHKNRKFCIFFHQTIDFILFLWYNLCIIIHNFMKGMYIYEKRGYQKSSFGLFRGT